MATFTLREVIDEAAERLGELATGQTLNADQLTKYQNNATMLLDQLGEDGIVGIADTDSIPASYVPYLATLLANLAGPGVGVAFNLQLKQSVEATLRKLVRGSQTFEILTPDYF
jgi:hypothetical protein